MDSSDPLIRGLNEPQAKAVQTIGGPLLILAGPGSGKTRVISHRVAYLVRTCGVAPRRIMAVTFTNRAARELKERIERLVGSAVDQLTVGTFHSICARILRIEATHLKLDPKFVIYDDEDQIKLMKDVLNQLHLEEGQVSPRAVLSGISRLKAELVPPDERQWRSRNYFDETVRRAYVVYQDRLGECGAVDFDDLINLTVRLLQDVPDVRERYQTRYIHLMVDEFQDTNIAQYELVKLIAGKHRNLAVVGDPDQSIYRFRSADIRNILNFERDFPDATLVRLEQNYRSTQSILDGAHGVIATNRRRKEKELWTDNGTGANIIVRELANEHDEARNVVQEIDRLVSKEEISYRDCAVMFRTNAQSRPIEQVCVLYGIPYRLVGGTRFYERREVKDLLAYLRLIQNPADAVALTRVINVPSRGIGQKTVDDLVRFARAIDQSAFETIQAIRDGADAGLAARAQRSLLEFLAVVEDLQGDAAELALPALVERVVLRTGYREYLEAEGEEGVERLENVQQLIAAAGELADREPRDALAAFLEEVALFTDADSVDSAADAMTLITLHAAKGLEYPVVFITGLEDGILPHSRSVAGADGEPDEDALEEERRLLYVGMTRAKQRLYLLRAYRRSFWGRNQPLPASRFLKDIPPEVRTDEALFGNRPIATPGRSLMGSAPSIERPVSRPLPPRPDHGVGSSRSTSSSGGSDREGASLRPGDRVRQAVLGEGIVVSVVPARGDFEVTVAFQDKRAGIKKLLASVARLEKTGAR